MATRTPNGFCDLAGTGANLSVSVSQNQLVTLSSMDPCAGCPRINQFERGKHEPQHKTTRFALKTQVNAMNALADIQKIKGPDGEPVFAVPCHEFMRPFAREVSLIPHTVVSATVDGASPMKAWREYLRLTQAEVATRMGVTRAVYAQVESTARPSKASIARVAAAFCITPDQLDF